MKVKAKRAHGNAYGDKYHKSIGDVYEHPSPEADIAAGLIENVQVKNPRVPRNGESVVSVEERNGQGRGEKGAKKGDDARLSSDPDKGAD